MDGLRKYTSVSLGNHLIHASNIKRESRNDIIIRPRKQ